MRKILVIEDEQAVRANIIELLEAEDFNVIGAENGFIGALGAQEHLPDLIVCDVRMPELNGYEVLEALRQVPVTATIPFIFLTANADKADMRQGMELGADDYLTKPFTRAELLSAIATRLAKHEVVMQQYISEHERAQALEQKIKQLQDDVENKEQLLSQFREELSTVVPKLSMAIHLLKNLRTGAQRDRALEILQQACNAEIALLNKSPYLQQLLTPENIDLLRQFNLVKD